MFAVRNRFSALQRAEIAEIQKVAERTLAFGDVSVLFNEPKLLKLLNTSVPICRILSFSALQRAEIAEMALVRSISGPRPGFSALQRAEIAEIKQPA